jgi:anti-sigma B factor antagonist
MKVKKDEKNGISVAYLDGRLYGGDDGQKVLDLISELLEAKKNNLVINCAKLEWIASTGLGILVTARSRYLKEGGVMRLCELNDRTVNLLSITQLEKVFECFATEEEALAAFSQDEAPAG